MTLVALENDGKRITKGGRAGLFCTAALIGSLAVQAWVIVAAGLGSEPAPEQVATFFEEYRFGLSIVGLLVIVAVAFFLMLLRGLYYWLGGSGLTGLALVTGSLGAASMTVFAVGVAVGLGRRPNGSFQMPPICPWGSLS